MDRREFLKISTLAIVGGMVSRSRLLAASVFKESPPPAPLGRIVSWYAQPVREAPEVQAKAREWKTRDTIIPLKARVEGEPPWPSNPIWYRTEEGYIHSAFVQPVEEQIQTQFIRRVSPPGLWAQVTVPVSGARWSPDSPYVMRKLYYENVFRIVAVVHDAQKRPWYQLQEGMAEFGTGPYAPAWELRVLSPRELTPIAPKVKVKHILINRSEQTLTCYHDATKVFHTRVATGLYDTPTPRGHFKVLYKRHTRRMVGTINGDDYDLPGIPFPVYITHTGVAIHGTYWHNDFGTPHSHGCVNVTATAAKWIFRWVTPSISYPDYTSFANEGNAGTPVTVV